LDTFPPSLRTAPRLRYCDDGVASYHPALLARVTTPDGKPATIHRTYLTPSGAKAAVSSPRKIFSAMPNGAAVRLALPVPTLGVAEGIETAFAASILFQVPTWAAICAAGVAKFEPPSVVEHLIVFGDNDDNHVGQSAAFALASRLSGRLKVDVMLPDMPGDWNDVLTGGK
jgi:putative DNA primase/helicase